MLIHPELIKKINPLKRGELNNKHIRWQLGRLLQISHVLPTRKVELPQYEVKLLTTEENISVSICFATAMYESRIVAP